VIVSKTPDHTDNRATVPSQWAEPTPWKIAAQIALFVAARGHSGGGDMLRSRPCLDAGSKLKSLRKALILNKYSPAQDIQSGIRKTHRHGRT
jgi:hypothetical protein